eukprot:SAG31_NODE_5058_length_2768_cov_1.632072_6_plen_44_part_00
MIKFYRYFKNLITVVKIWLIPVYVHTAVYVATGTAVSYYQVGS